MARAAIDDPFRVTAALSDGQRLYAFRFASDARPPTLYWRRDGEAIQVVSEPLDRCREQWNAVPAGHAHVCCQAGDCEIVPLEFGMAAAA